MNVPSPVSIALGAALVAAAATGAPAHATRVTAQATAICQGALPAFETAIRKRPLALQNEGTQAAFVTCAFVNPGPSDGSARVEAVLVYLQNVNAQTQQVSCTAVNSTATASPAPALYLTKGAFVTPSATSSTQLRFAAAEFGGGASVLPGDTVGVSCNLPPGVGITGTVLVNNS